MRPFAFFVGTNGSGTTLHRAIFDSHPDLSIPGEASSWSNWAEIAPIRVGRLRHASGLVKDRRKQDRFANWGLDPDHVCRPWPSRPLEDFPGCDPPPVRPVRQPRGKSRYADKTQANIHHLLLLAGLFSSG